MGEKDITEKILEDHNDVFADIINGLIFAGEQRILIIVVCRRKILRALPTASRFAIISCLLF